MVTLFGGWHYTNMAESICQAPGAFCPYNVGVQPTGILQAPGNDLLDQVLHGRTLAVETKPAGGRDCKTLRPALHLEKAMDKVSGN